MAYVEKILIKGIRSFDPENTTPLVLFKPLTLIVGSNGAGKTTVIEALRVACTGTLPPNARLGQNFVHDPKIAKEREVKAQIMVRFYNTAGDPFVVIRSYQLIQKPQSLQFKAIDQTLKKLDTKTNEKLVITHTCADMDKIVPTMMGVSKAVLDNVIFVHQDESNWPLAEPKVLKEKFDLLFGTSAYSKWFEDVRKLKSEKAAELKMKKMELEHLKTHKTNAARLRAQTEEMQKEIDSAKQEIDEWDIKIRMLMREIEELEASLQLLSEKETAIFVLQSKRKTVEQTNTELFESLVDGDFEEDDEELNEALEECDVAVGQMRETVNSLDNEAGAAQETVSVLKDQYSEACQKQGRLYAEVTAHERNVKERDVFLKKLAMLYSIPYEGDDESFVTAFEEMVLQRESRLDEAKSVNKTADANRSDQWRQLVMKIETLFERKRLQHNELSQNDLKKKQLDKKAIEIVIDDADLEDLEAREKEVLASLDSNRQRREARDIAAEITAESTQIDRLIQRIRRVKQERSRVTDASENDTKIRLKKTEISQKREQLAELMMQNRRRLAELLGQATEPQRLKDLYASVWTSLQARFTQAEEQLRCTQSAQSLSQNERDLIETELRSKEAAVAGFQKQLRKGLRDVEGDEVDVDTFEAYLSNCEQKCHELKERSSLGEASMRLLKAYIKTAESDASCPTCERTLTEVERQSFIFHQKKTLENAPSEIENQRLILEGIEARIATLKRLQPVWIQYALLKNETLPALRCRLEEYDQSRLNHSTAVQAAKDTYTLLHKRVEETKGLAEDVIWTANNLLQDVEGAEAAVEEMRKLSLEDNGSRGLVEIEEELEQLENEKFQHELAKDALQKEQQELSTEYMTLTQSHLQIKRDIEKYRTASANTEVYQAQLREFEEKNRVLDENLNEIEAELQTLQPRKDRLKSLHDEQRDQAMREEKELEKQAREARQQWELAMRKILIVNDFQESESVKDLEQSRQQLSDLEEEQKRLQIRMEEIQKTRRERIEDIQKHHSYRRSVEDCLKWREGKRKADRLVTEIEQLEQEISKIESKLTLTRKLRKLQKDMDNAKDAKSRSAGSLATLQRTQINTKEELESDLYAGIEEKYKAIMVETVLLEMGIDDLVTFHKACEKALLAYHSMKMEEINASMKELWRNIYKGSDIESIQIKAEEVKGHVGRTHNYRLSMYVEGSELEMRGRCSAGQKVLAGIIVRLALADTFCVKCGILALDEPTTNLDAANIESLADALREIIESRQQQKNFQLIVITHDDQFARSLRSREHAEFLWRVTKDDRNHTIVTRERI